MVKEFKDIYIASISLLIIFIGGISGYIIIEDYTFFEAFYMTVITVSTVGYGEVHPLSQTGMLFTAILIVFSLGFFGYFLTSITRIFIDGEYKKLVKIYLRNKKISKLKNHVIVCGFGRNGRQAVIDLLERGEKVIIIDNQTKVIHEDINEEIINNKNVTIVHGDASHEETLFKVNIENAKAMILTLPNDAENLLIILTSRDINTRMKIISRASDEHSYSKLKRAGADNVIMPDIVGGSRMAKLVSEPDIVEFLEMIMLRDGVDVNLEEISCNDLASCFVNSTISELDIRKKTGANIIGLKLGNGEYRFNPSGDRTLRKEDKLFVLGKVEQISKLKSLLENGKYFDE
ncbi:MAG: potassium channel protein [Chlorobi bacterium]|nr:potassium channel protein [Chlorobiota bacterium]